MPKKAAPLRAVRSRRNGAPVEQPAPQHAVAPQPPPVPPMTDDQIRAGCGQAIEAVLQQWGCSLRLVPGPVEYVGETFQKTQTGWMIGVVLASEAKR